MSLGSRQLDAALDRYLTTEPDWEVDDIDEPESTCAGCAGHNDFFKCAHCEALIPHDDDGMILTEDIAEIWWPKYPDKESALCHATCMTEDMAIA